MTHAHASPPLYDVVREFFPDADDLRCREVLDELGGYALYHEPEKLRAVLRIRIRRGELIERFGLGEAT